jgi:UDP:flavonoid glycosyltransferase YjiC (YdhE family)
MSTILLSTWGSYGDLFPYLALAIRLKQLGHAPIVATCPFYRDIVERAGVGFHPVPPDVDPTNDTLLARVMDPARGSEVVVRELAAAHVRAAFDATRTAARDADAIVTHPVAFAGPLVARALGRPWLSVALAPTTFFSIHDLPLLPPAPGLMRLMRSTTVTARAFMGLARRVTRSWTAPARELARELRLPDAGDPLYEGQYSPFGTLALYSPVLGGPQPDWPPHTTITGFVFHDQEPTLDAALQAFLDEGEPPIVFTLGSSAVGAPGAFYDESARAAETLGRRAVLLVGKYSAAPTGPRARGVFAAAYAPHAALFARAAAVVHHGGVGTLAQALRAGRPMLVVPHAHDQPDNAFRAARLGVARVLDARRYTAARVERHLRALLDEPQYRARAEAVGARVAAERGTDVACEAIVRVAHGGPNLQVRPQRADLKVRPSDDDGDVARRS